MFNLNSLIAAYLSSEVGKVQKNPKKGGSLDPGKLPEPASGMFRLISGQTGVHLLGQQSSTRRNSKAEKTEMEASLKKDLLASGPHFLILYLKKRFVD